MEIRIPTLEEWNLLVKITCGINRLMHWKNMRSWVHDVENKFQRLPDFRAMRGGDTPQDVRDGYVTYRGDEVGFRPAIPACNYRNGIYCPDRTAVIVGTMYMNDAPIKIPRNPTRYGDTQEYIPGASLELRSALQDADYQVMAIKVGDAFVADRNLLKSISYDDIINAIKAKED